jgi:hypothetical protein
MWSTAESESRNAIGFIEKWPPLELIRLDGQQPVVPAIPARTELQAKLHKSTRSRWEEML